MLGLKLVTPKPKTKNKRQMIPIISDRGSWGQLVIKTSPMCFLTYFVHGRFSDDDSSKLTKLPDQEGVLQGRRVPVQKTRTHSGHQSLNIDFICIKVTKCQRRTEPKSKANNCIHASRLSTVSSSPVKEV